MRSQPTSLLSASIDQGPDELRTYGFDVTAYLTLWMVLLCGLSAYQVVRGVGAIGSPAMLVAMPAFLLWLAGWVLPRSGLQRTRNPIRVALVSYLGYQIFSYSVATSRSVTELEASGSVRALLTAFAMAGIGLLVTDGVADQRRLETLLRRLTFGVAVVAAIGIAEFFTGARLQALLPGLEWNRTLGGLGARSIFSRPSGTAMHPIELSVITASMLPLAVHFSLYGPSPRRRQAAAVAAVALGLALPLSLSRSGLLSLVVAMVILFAGWGWRRRANGFLVGLAAVPILWALIPGLVGTLVNLFADAEEDTSVQVRIDRIPRVMALVRARPLFGIGNGTFSVEDYFLLDNQIYGTTIEMGMVGMALTVTLFLAGMYFALATRGLPTADEQTRHLGLAIAAAIAGLSISIVTFDSLFYRILTGSLYVLIGSAGALWRMHRGSEQLAADLRRDRRSVDPGS